MDSSQFPCSHPQDPVAHAEAAANELLSSLRWVHQGGPQKAAGHAWTSLRCLQSLDVNNVEEPARGAILELKEKVLEATKKRGIKTWDTQLIASSLKKLRKKLSLPKQEAVIQEAPQAAKKIAQGKLAAAHEIAYRSYQLAVSRMEEERPTDKEAYVWLKKYAPDQYEFPGFETWRRYLRAGRRFYQDQKNSPRAGRNGRSIVKAKDM